MQIHPDQNLINHCYVQKSFHIPLVTKVWWETWGKLLNSQGKKRFEGTVTRYQNQPSSQCRVTITEPQAVPVTVLHICQAATSLCSPCVIASASAILISYPVVTFLFLYLKQVPQQFLSAPKVRLCHEGLKQNSLLHRHSPASESRSLFPISQPITSLSNA